MKKILVVEDDRRIALALTVRLRASGFEVITAPDALAGVNQARKHEPALVVLDLMMPAGGGLKVAERLRNLTQTATVPIIFLTASKDADMKRQALEFSPVAYLEKPYDAQDLLNAVHEAMAAPI